MGSEALGLLVVVGLGLLLFMKRGQANGGGGGGTTEPTATFTPSTIPNTGEHQAKFEIFNFGPNESIELKLNGQIIDTVQTNSSGYYTFTGIYNCGGISNQFCYSARGLTSGSIATACLICG